MDRVWGRKDEGKGGAQMALRPRGSLSCPCPTGPQAHVPMGTSSFKDSAANTPLKEAGLKFPSFQILYKPLDSAQGRV